MNVRFDELSYGTNVILDAVAWSVEIEYNSVPVKLWDTKDFSGAYTLSIVSPIVSLTFSSDKLYIKLLKFELLLVDCLNVV